MRGACACVRVCARECVHIIVCACILCAFLWARVRECACTWIHTCVCVYVCECTCCVCVHKSPYMYVCVCWRVYARMHLYCSVLYLNFWAYHCVRNKSRPSTCNFFNVYNNIDQTVSVRRGSIL